MNTFEVLILIVAIVFGARLLRDRARSGEDGSIARPDDDVRILTEEVARLRDRVQVLERVVTDHHGSSDLERRIEALRDQEGRA